MSHKQQTRLLRQRSVGYGAAVLPPQPGTGPKRYRCPRSRTAPVSYPPCPRPLPASRRATRTGFHGTQRAARLAKAALKKPLPFEPKPPGRPRAGCFRHRLIPSRAVAPGPSAPPRRTQTPRLSSRARRLLRTGRRPPAAPTGRLPPCPALSRDAACTRLLPGPCSPSFARFQPPAKRGEARQEPRPARASAEEEAGAAGRIPAASTSRPGFVRRGPRLGPAAASREPSPGGPGRPRRPGPRPPGTDAARAAAPEPPAGDSDAAPGLSRPPPPPPGRADTRGCGRPPACAG